MPKLTTRQAIVSLLLLGGILWALHMFTATRPSVPLNSQSAAVVGAAWAPAYMQNLPSDYLERLRQSLLVMVDNGSDLKCGDAQCSDAGTSDTALRPISWTSFGIAAFMLNQRTSDVNRYFASSHYVWPAHEDFGFGLFSVDYMRLYALFKSGSPYMPGKITPQAQAKMEQGMWAVAKQFCTLAAANKNVWESYGSENHHAAKTTGCFLAAQFLKDNPTYASQRYADGSTLAQQYTARRNYISTWIDERGKRGLFVEAASPVYEDETIGAYSNIRDFAEDPVLRKKAEMFLDLAYANMAEETLYTTRGGPKARTKNNDRFYSFSDRSYDLMFNSPGRTFAPLGNITRTTSNYYPPAAVVKLAADTATRGTYAYAKRWPGPGNANENGDHWDVLETTRSNVRYGFTTPSYVLGSAGVNTDWDYINSGHRWEGVVFSGDMYAKIGVGVEPAFESPGDSFHAFDPFVALQDRNVLITQVWAPAPPNSPLHLPVFLKLYFSPTLDEVWEEPKWIFVKEGNAYAAVRVVSGGYEWTPSAGWTHAEGSPVSNLRFITLRADSPVIIVVNEAKDYGNDFEKFKRAVRAQPLSNDNGVLTFSTLTFYGTAQLGKINGTTLNLSPALGYNSPFIRSAWNSGLICIKKGSDTLALDFRSSTNPSKTTSAYAACSYPAGVGADQPIIFPVPVGVDGASPTVSFSAPAPNATVSGLVTLAATASDNVAVTAVEFKNGSVTMGTDTSLPYSYPWNTTLVPNGARTLNVVARDAAGNRATSTRTVTVANTASVDTTLPTVAITTPTTGATVSGSAVTLSAMASDNRAIASVQFLVDGKNVGAPDTAQPYTVQWNSSAVANGSHSITATARDTSGNARTSVTTVVQVSNQVATPLPVPVVSVSPGTYDRPMRITLSAPGAGSIHYTFDGTAPTCTTGLVYTAPITITETVTLKAIACPSATPVSASKSFVAAVYESVRSMLASVFAVVTGGGVQPSPVSTFRYVITPDSILPSISITAPAVNAVVSGNAVVLSADASDNVDVSRVIFQIDGANVGSRDRVAPYQIVWNSLSIPNGTHTLSATVSDVNGNIRTASSRAIRVSNPATTTPTCALIAPATATASTPITLSWTSTSAPTSATLKQGATLLSGAIALPTGTRTLTPPATAGTYTYTLSVTNAAGTGTCSKKVIVTTVPAHNNHTPIGNIGQPNQDNQNCSISGWACDLDNLGTDLEIELYEGSTKLGQVKADVIRNNNSHDIALACGAAVNADGTFTKGFTPTKGFRVIFTGLTKGTHWISGYAKNINSAGMQSGTRGTLPRMSGYTGPVVCDPAIMTGTLTNAKTINIPPTPASTDTTLPTVSITAPAADAAVSGVVTLSASASDNIGLRSVQFRIDGVVVGPVFPSGPYVVEWGSTSVADGAHTVSATAIDTNGNTKTSAAVTIHVNNADTVIWTSEQQGVGSQ